jgi:hypothetical protein
MVECSTVIRSRHEKWQRLGGAPGLGKRRRELGYKRVDRLSPFSMKSNAPAVLPGRPPCLLVLTKLGADCQTTLRGLASCDRDAGRSVVLRDVPSEVSPETGSPLWLS